MGRHRVRFATIGNGLLDERLRPITPTWALFYRTEFTEMVGWRVRRLRTGRDWSQHKLATEIRHPNGDNYSAGLISRIEKGHANPPLHAYIHIAEALDTEPGRLLGPHDLEAEFSADERALILFLRRTELPIDEALARLVRPAPPGTS